MSFFLSAVCVCVSVGGGGFSPFVARQYSCALPGLQFTRVVVPRLYLYASSALRALALLWFIIVIVAWIVCLYLQCVPIKEKNIRIQENYDEQTAYANYWTHADLVNKISLVRLQRGRLQNLVRPFRVYPLAFFTLSAPLAVYASWDMLHVMRSDEEQEEVMVDPALPALSRLVSRRAPCLAAAAPSCSPPYRPAPHILAPAVCGVYRPQLWIRRPRTSRVHHGGADVPVRPFAPRATAAGPASLTLEGLLRVPWTAACCVSD